MSLINYRHISSDKKGFTLVEVLIAIVLTGVVSTILFTFFITSFNQYFALQQDGIVYGDLAQQSQRVAMILRGITDISQATSSEITAITYFSPNDTVVSQVHYYLSADQKKLYADVTPYSASPPSGSLLTDQKRTYTVISDFYVVPGVDTFTYYSTGSSTLTLPISDTHVIKQIKISLGAPTRAPSANGYNQVSVQVFLRNRKTNL